LLSVRPFVPAPSAWQGFRAPAVVAVLAALVSLLPAPARAQAFVRVNDDISFRLAVHLQGWADWQQDATGGYEQNLFLRRARFLVDGTVGRDVTFLFMTENPSLGRSTQIVAGGPGAKSLSAGFLLQDAFVEWRITDGFRLEGGLYVVPFCRNCLQSTSNLLTLDISNLVALANGVTQSSAIRDTGIGAKGYLFEDRFEYRASVFSGERAPGAKDAFRFAGRVQYDAFDTEIGYTYAGTSLGKKKILAIGAGSDNQGDYHAYSADVFFDIPVFKGDAAGGQAAWFQYDGRTRFPSLPKQNDYLLELGYYLSKAHFQPFAQFQTQRFLQEAITVKNVDRYQAGFNLYIHGQNLKFTPAFTRLIPNDPVTPPTNEFTVQLQVFYY
jgi:Phosphate-selective porin O and P